MQWELTIQGLQPLIEGLAAFGGDATLLLEKAVTASLNKVAMLARANAPHRTGTLQRSILPEQVGLFGVVKVNEKYGIYLEGGTGPFDIYPRNKKALFWPGAAHPVSVVHHPGIKARPFFEPAILEAQPFIQAQFRAVGQTLLRNIAARSKI